MFKINSCFPSRFPPSLRPDINLQGFDPEPEFEGTIQNVTFPAGREAVLTCSVRNLGRYKVNFNNFLFPTSCTFARSSVINFSFNFTRARLHNHKTGFILSDFLFIIFL